MKPVVKILILLSVGLHPTLPCADCITECMNRKGCFSGGMGSQTCGYQNSHGFEMCGIECRGKTTTAYGAIAFSLKEKISGWSYDQPNQAAAERTAMQYCAKSGGSKCAVQASFHNICGAIATDGSSVFWGTASTKSGAEQRALSECGGPAKKCEVQSSVCSSPGAGAGSSLPSTPPKPKAVAWGAIAYSASDMGAGWSQGKDDRASAEKAAMALCAQRGKACVLQTAFNKQCGALAADGNFTGWAVSTDQRQALVKAMDDCKKAGGTRCVPHIAFCSF